MSHADIVIVGGGAAGLATAWQLAARGDAGRVVLVERNRLLAAESSALNAAILRTLDDDPLTARIALRSADFLRSPPHGFSEVPLVDRRGLLLLAAKGEEARLRRQAEAVGERLRFEWADRERVRALQPWVRPDGEGGVFMPDEGQIDIAALMAGFARGARAGGVEILRGTPVEAIVTAHGRVRGVRLANGDRLDGRRVVIASGGWAAQLGARAGSRVRLRPTRRHLMVTRPSDRIDRRWPVVWQLGRDPFYARPESGGMLLCACDLTDVDPDHLQRDDDVRDTIARKAARYLPDLLGVGAGQFWCGVRTLAADGRFVVGADGDVEGLYWVAGLAGAGMVCSAEVGRLAAAMLVGDAVGAPAIDESERAALSPSRPAVLEAEGRGSASD
jgi:D-arginine dehydrogenase